MNTYYCGEYSGYFNFLNWSMTKVKDLIATKELARQLGISTKALRIRVSKGKIAQPVKREADELYWYRKDAGVGSEGGLRRDELQIAYAESPKAKGAYQ